MRKDSGFSLTELLTIIAIVGILAAIAIPNFINWRSNSQLGRAARDLYSQFQKAKIEAVRRNTFCTITFNQQVGGTTFDYVVYADADQDMEYDGGEEVITSILWSSYPGVSLDSGGVTFPDNDDSLPTIAFAPDGLPRKNTPGLGSGIVFLKNKGAKRNRVVVSTAGNIRIE